MHIELVDVVGGPICVDTSDGHKVNQIAAECLASDSPVTISFSGVDRITTAFLNAAVGQLYNEFSDDHIRRYLRFENMTPIVSSSLIKVIVRAKEFFSDPEKFKSATDSVMDED